MLPIYFLARDAPDAPERLHPAYRPSGEGTPKHLLELLLAGPDEKERASGMRSSLPAGARLLEVKRLRGELLVDVSDLGGPGAVALSAAQIAATLSSFPEIPAVRVCERSYSARAILRSQFLNPVLFPARHAATAKARPVPASTPGESEAPPKPAGPLAGKVIVISGGHGYTRLSSGRWFFQRPQIADIREDRLNLMFAIQAIRELRRLGATVYSPRAALINEERGVSGAWRWEEAAKYYLRDIGAPDWVYQAIPTDFESDIDARPLYANYLGADLLISIHNNLGHGAGTLTLYDTTNGFGKQSRRLAQLLQRHVVSGIRSELVPGWRSVGAQGSNAQYGENHWAHMPSALVEVGFMDSGRERRWLARREFREVVGRAIAAAVADYFEVPATPLPGPPPPDDALPVVMPRPASPSVIVCVGDPAGAKSAAYASRLQARLASADGNPGLRVLAPRSDPPTISALLEDWEESVAKARPSYVLLSFGRQDLVKGGDGSARVPVARFEADLMEAVRRTRALNAVPVLVTLAPIHEASFYARHGREGYAADGGVQALRDAYNAAIRRVARKTRARLADVSRASWQRPEDWLTQEGEEPTLTESALDRTTALFAEALGLP